MCKFIFNALIVNFFAGVFEGMLMLGGVELFSYSVLSHPYLCCFWINKSQSGCNVVV